MIIFAYAILSLRHNNQNKKLVLCVLCQFYSICGEWLGAWEYEDLGFTGLGLCFDYNTKKLRNGFSRISGGFVVNLC